MVNPKLKTQMPYFVWTTLWGLLHGFLFFGAEVNPTFANETQSIPPSDSGSAKLYQDILEREFSLRHSGKLQITNLRGGVKVYGWALDRIRIRATRSIHARSVMEATKSRNAMDFRFRDIDGSLELSAVYGKGLSIEERLQEKNSPLSSMEITVYAPFNVPLQIWTQEGEVFLKDWNHQVEVRTNSGHVGFEGIRASEVSVSCPSCTLKAKDVHGNLRMIVNKGQVSLSRCRGDQYYFEVNQGDIRLNEVKGAVLAIMKTGTFKSQDLEGEFEFHMDEASVEVSHHVGSLSGKTESGSITAQVLDWRFKDKAFLDSNSGDIRLTLPSKFSAEVELKSGKEISPVEFEIVKTLSDSAENESVFGLLQGIVMNRWSQAIGKGLDWVELRFFRLWNPAGTFVREARIAWQQSLDRFRKSKQDKNEDEGVKTIAGFIQSAGALSVRDFTGTEDKVLRVSSLKGQVSLYRYRAH